MSVSWELAVRVGNCLPRSAVWLKQNCGVKFSASGVLDMTSRAGLGCDDASCEGGGGDDGLARFQSMPARLVYISSTLHRTRFIDRWSSMMML